MKIAFIGARGVVGKYSGIETYYEEIGSRLAALGHDVTIYCRSYFTPAVDRYRGMRIRRFPTVRSKHLETVVHTALSTFDSLFKHYDIVQFHALGSAPFAFVPRLVGSKTVVSVRGLDGRRAKWGGFARRYLETCEWASVRCPTATSVVSAELARYFAERYDRDVTYIPNGVTLRSQVSADYLEPLGLSERDYILYVGRLTPEKACEDLIAAYKSCDTNLKLAFVGGSTYADSYVEKLKKEASDRILFLGFQEGDALAALFSNAYFYVLPSRIEGLSVSLLEAMAYGNCVLTSDIPENRDIVKDCGETFRTGDVANLAEQMQYLLNSPEVVGRRGAAARAFIEANFTWDIIAKQTDAFYRELMSGQVTKRRLGFNYSRRSG